METHNYKSVHYVILYTVCQFICEVALYANVTYVLPYAFSIVNYYFIFKFCRPVNTSILFCDIIVICDIHTVYIGAIFVTDVRKINIFHFIFCLLCDVHELYY